MSISQRVCDLPDIESPSSTRDQLVQLWSGDALFVLLFKMEHPGVAVTAARATIDHAIHIDVECDDSAPVASSRVLMIYQFRIDGLKKKRSYDVTVGGFDPRPVPGHGCV